MRSSLIWSMGLVAWMALVAIAFGAGEPSSTMEGGTMLALGRGALAAAVAALACAGAGGAILKWWRPEALDDSLGWLRAVGTGLVLWGLLSLPAALLLGVHPWVGAMSVVILSSGWLARPPVRAPTIPAPVALVGLLFLAPALLSAASPVVDTDEQYYHLALPARMLLTGELGGGPWMPNASRPLALHLPWAWLLALGGEAAPRLFHLSLVAALLLGLRERVGGTWGPAAGAVAALALLGSATFLAKAGLAYNDIPAALLAWLAVDSARHRRLLGPVALWAGGALAVKYTALTVVAPLLAGVVLIAAMGRGPHRPGQALAAAGGAALVLAPWLIRNLADGLHPLFPYLGWPELAFQFTEKYGAGRGLSDFLLLPWNVVMKAETDSFTFLGRLNPIFLALAPAAFRAARDPRARPFLIIAACGLMIWAMGPHWLRYLIPVLPVAAHGLGAAMASAPPLARRLAWGVWLVGLPANMSPVLSSAADLAPVVTGRVDQERWIEEQDRAWTCKRWVNDHTPGDARVAFLYAWQSWGLERPWEVGSVEDHVPARALLAEHGEGSLRALRDGGVTHVIVGNTRFIRKAFPFMEPEGFREAFQEPGELLQRLLSTEAELVFADGRYAVWRL